MKFAWLGAKNINLNTSFNEYFQNIGNFLRSDNLNILSIKKLKRVFL